MQPLDYLLPRCIFTHTLELPGGHSHFVIKANDEFHRLSELINEETGAFDSKRIFFEWNEWARSAIKRKSVA